MSATAAAASPRDHVAEALAAFALHKSGAPSPEVSAAARLALLDALAVALGALDHPATAAAHRYARLLPAVGLSRVWGTDLLVAPETAALVNGVPLRAYDFNDLYMGAGTGGHPSDMLTGLVAVAEWRRSTGAALIDAIAAGYEVCLELLDTLAMDPRGWDYVNLTGLAATCAVGRLMGLDHRQLVAALGITAVAHAASLEIESGELNARGDLTMWKRFNGGDAVRHAVYACQLASVGVEGPVRAFEGRHGFLALLDDRPEARETLLKRLERRAPPQRIRQVTFKRWPVGSRAQGAIQAALEARAQIADVSAIRAVRVFTQKAVHEHLVARRHDPWNPHSRETADHSLPYIVGAAVLDGFIGTQSFEPATVTDPARQRFLSKVTVAVEPALDSAPQGQFLARVEIETDDGKVQHGRALPPPGHPAQPFVEADVIAKLTEGAGSALGVAAVDRLVTAVRSLDRAPDLTVISESLGPPASDTVKSGAKRKPAKRDRK